MNTNSESAMDDTHDQPEGLARPLTRSTDVDALLAALGRALRGESLTHRQRGLVASFETEIAKRRFGELAGRLAVAEFDKFASSSPAQRKLLSSLGVPVGGRTVDLFEVLAVLIDMAVDDDGNDDALNELRRVRVLRERLNYQREAGRLVPVDAIEAYVSQLGSVLRQHGEKLQKEYGPAAYEFHVEMLADVERLGQRVVDDLKRDQEGAEPVVGDE